MEADFKEGKFQNLDIRELISKYKMVLVLIILVGASSLISDNFLTNNNLENIARQVSVNGVLACGMTFVMITGGFDLSVGSSLSVTGVIAIALQPVIGVGGSIIIALIVGALLGSVNGIILSKINADSGDAFMITLGSLLAFSGIALLLTDARVLPGSNSEFYNSLGQGTIFWFIPIPVFIFILITVISHFILTSTVLGRKIYMIGGNYEASRLSGIHVEFYKGLVYSIAGVSAAIAGIILSSRTLGGSPLAGVGYELDAIAAVIIGGISLKGGEGNIIMTLIGVFIIGVLSNILNLIGLSSFNQMIVKGMIIVLAVWSDKKK